MKRSIFLLGLLACGAPSAGGGPAPDAAEQDPGDPITDAGAGPKDAAAPGRDASPNSDATVTGDAAPLADAAATHDASVFVDAGGTPPSPAPTAYVTTADLTQALADLPVTLGGPADAAVTITVDPGTTYQSMVGFGASITDSSSFVLTKYLSPADLATALVKLFDAKDGIGLGFLRQPMGASDFSSAGNFSYDDGVSDSPLSHFNIDQDKKATLPILRQILAIHPETFVLATPWSPPAWMKLNSSMDGAGGAPGNSGLAGSAYAPLADYFLKFVQAYRDEGVAVSAVTPQNEPLNGTGNYPGMDFNAPSETSFIGQNLGPVFASAGVSTQIWAYDHNWDVESYPATVVSDSTAGQFTEGAAFHCYGGDPSAMTVFHNAFPTKSVYMTECSGGTWQSAPFANTIDLAIDSTNNWARAVVLWNMALDENAGPENHGCNDCRGVITVNSASGAVTYNADYYALGHFSKFVARGAVRIASTSSDGAMHHVAFRNPDGRLALVLHNTGANALRVQIPVGTTTLGVTVPGGAAATVTWGSM